MDDFYIFNLLIFFFFIYKNVKFDFILKKKIIHQKSIGSLDVLMIIKTKLKWLILSKECFETDQMDKLFKNVEINPMYNCAYLMHSHT